MPRVQITRPFETLTLEGAKRATVACEKKANEIGVPMNIAIVDATLNLVQFTRMTDAKLTSVSIAMDKAFTAAGHKVPTHTYKDAVWSGGVAFGINHSNGGRFSTIGGGFPIKNAQGQVVGGIGCSTGTPAQDQQVAQAGLVGTPLTFCINAHLTPLGCPERVLDEYILP